MKVVYYAHSLLSRGGDRMVLAHVGWLAAHGHEVELCCNVVDTVLQIPERVRITQPRLPGAVGTVLSALFERRDADLVLASIIPMACFLFPRSRRKVVYFAQDNNENLYPTLLQKLFIRLLYSIGLRAFRIPVVAVSEQLAEIFRSRYRAQVQVVLNGVDRQSFYPDPSPELVASKHGKQVILIFSRRDQRKGFDLALTALNRLAEMNFSPVELWTVGEPLSEGEVTLPRRDFGYVGEAELRRIYSSADLLLYPSRNEGFGLMPLEAMACGCPVVTTTAVPYAVHMDNAMVAPTGDCDVLAACLQKLVLDEELRNSLRDAGQQFARMHSLSAATLQFETVLAGIVQR